MAYFLVFAAAAAVLFSILLFLIRGVIPLAAPTIFLLAAFSFLLTAMFPYITTRLDLEGSILFYAAAALGCSIAIYFMDRHLNALKKDSTGQVEAVEVILSPAEQAAGANGGEEAVISHGDKPVENVEDSSTNTGKKPGECPAREPEQPPPAAEVSTTSGQEQKGQGNRQSSLQEVTQGNRSPQREGPGDKTKAAEKPADANPVAATKPQTETSAAASDKKETGTAQKSAGYSEETAAREASSPEDTKTSLPGQTGETPVENIISSTGGSEPGTSKLHPLSEHEGDSKTGYKEKPEEPEQDEEQAAPGSEDTESLDTLASPAPPAADKEAPETEPGGKEKGPQPAGTSPARQAGSTAPRKEVFEEESLNQYITRGFSLRQAGELTRAAECFTKALHLTLEPELNVRLGLELSAIYYQMGQDWQAKQILKIMKEQWQSQLPPKLLQEINESLRVLKNKQEFLTN